MPEDNENENDEDEKEKPEPDAEPPGLSPELRGVVVEEKSGTNNALWIASAAMTLILIVFCSWTFLFITRTDDEILKEKLKTHPVIKQMLGQSSIAVQNRAINAQQLESAIQSALDIAETPLRQGQLPSPPIPERNLAIITALEGLLRLDLAMGLDTGDDSDYAFFRDQLDRLGRMDLEYYEQGILIHRPLIENSVLRQEIRKVSQRQHQQAQAEIAELKQQLAQLEERESFTVAAPALLLGKWYRYHNDMDNAKRCFEIGRQYVEGMRFDGEHFPGHYPKRLNPVWDEYVGCLEGLMEMAFLSGQFRIAQSYLVRIFNTPDHDSPIEEGHFRQRHHHSTKQSTQDIKRDIATIERAIADPMQLPSFPLFSSDDDTVAWSSLLGQLQQARQQPGRTPTNLLWEQLDTSVQELVISWEAGSPVPQTLKIAALEALNQMLKDPALVQKTPVDKNTLSRRARQILSREGERTLTQEELFFLNRDIIDTALGEAVNNRFTLSDGTRLHNTLPPQQVALLISVYQKHLVNRPEDHQIMRDRVQGIYSGDITATITDLYAALNQRRQWYRQQITDLDVVVKEEDAALAEVREAIQALEAQETLDIDTLLQYRDKEQRAYRRQLSAHTERRRLAVELEAAESQINEITIPFQHTLDDLQVALNTLQQNKLGSHCSHNLCKETPQLPQIERQIALNVRYLDLLNKLKATSGDTELQRLRDEYTMIERSISELEPSIDIAKGDELERLQELINNRYSQRHNLVTAFNQLFDPLKTIVKEIAAEEEQLWEAERRLRQAREEGLSILGTDTETGSLERKSRRRAALLLLKPDNAMIPQLYEGEIRKLSEEIAAEHARLHILLDAEQTAHQSLAIAQPELFITADGQPESTSGLAGLKSYLEEQDDLFERYTLLWRQRELQEEIRNQETLILNTLTMMAESIDIKDELSESQTTALSRLMQQLQQGRNRLRQLHGALYAVIKKGSAIELDDIGPPGRGYMLDSAELFQMEYQMGLNLKQYRSTFEERSAIIEELKETLAEDKALEQKKLAAARRRDQREIDRLLPAVSEKQTIINILVTRLEEINNILRGHGEEYRSNYDRLCQYRESIDPEMNALKQSIADISKKMASKDKELRELSSEMISLQEALKKTVTSLDVDNLSDIDTLITNLDHKITRLKHIRDLKLRQHHYQAKALWLIGRCLYEQSQLPDFTALVTANQIPHYTLESERRHGIELIPDYDQEFAYSDQMFGELQQEQDQNRINYEMWVDFLERTALDILQRKLPEYTRGSHDELSSSELFTAEQHKDHNIFVARSRFLAGQIHLRRALRAIRSTNFTTKDSNDAVAPLTAAELAFEGYVDFVTPLIHKTDTGLPILTETILGSQEFPTRQRQPVNLLSDTYVYLGVIATLKNNYLGAIEHYRDMLSQLNSSQPNSRFYFETEGITTGQYETQVAPDLYDLLTKEPLAHEVLYRLGVNYQALAEEEYQATIAAENTATWIPPALESRMSGGLSAENHRERFIAYAQQASAYYSQLILTQAFSPYRKGAVFRRAQLRQKLGDFNGARNDLISILTDPDHAGGSWEQKDLTAKGDLPGELDPGYSYIAFELGKLYFETKDYTAAAEAFLMAKGDHDDQTTTVINSRIAYAETLKASSRWVMANYFLTQLIKEREYVVYSLKHLYHPDLNLDLAEVQRHLGNLTTSLKTTKEFLRYAPKSVIVDGELNLDNRLATRLLKTEYRDLIRPLARYALHCAEVSETLKKFDDARHYYSLATKLYPLVPWQQDRKMRHMARDAYEHYRDTKGLTARWQRLRCDVLELQNSTLAGFQADLNNSQTNAFDQEKIDALTDTINNAIEQTQLHTNNYRDLLDKVVSFYEKEYARLPEVAMLEEVASRKEANKRSGGHEILRYEALRRVRTAILSADTTSTPTQLLSGMVERFIPQSVENKIISDAIVDYSTEISMSETDRSGMHAGKPNIDNLLTIKDADSRLQGIDQALLKWLKREMTATGLDEIFIPLSAEGAVLEEVALVQASLLSVEDSYDNYQALVALTNRFLAAKRAQPTRVQNGDYAWQIAEIAALAAEDQKDWERVEKYSRYLLDPTHAPTSVPYNEQLLPQKQAAFAQALVKLSQKAYEDLVFTFDEEEKERLQERAEKRLNEAQGVLAELQKTKGQSLDAVTARIRARQMLEEVGI